MSAQEKKRQRIYDLLNAETKLKFIFLRSTKQKTNISQKKSFLMGIEQKNEKKAF